MNQLAELLGKWAREGAKISGQNGVNCGRMCHDCAFKPNQPQTEAFLSAAQDAADCLDGRGYFNCHTPDHEDHTGTPCLGFWYAKQYLATIETE